MKYQEYKQISMCLLTVLIKDINNSFHQIIDEIVWPPPPSYVSTPLQDLLYYCLIWLYVIISSSGCSKHLFIKYNKIVFRS